MPLEVKDGGWMLAVNVHTYLGRIHVKREELAVASGDTSIVDTDRVSNVTAILL